MPRACDLKAAVRIFSGWGFGVMGRFRAPDPVLAGRRV